MQLRIYRRYLFGLLSHGESGCSRRGSPCDVRSVGPQLLGAAGENGKVACGLSLGRGGMALRRVAVEIEILNTEMLERLDSSLRN